MTVFELIRQEVTAEDAAKLYSLRFDRSGRGFCPWHDDGKHAALQFFDDGGCYCHACHEGGDATALTAQMLGLTPLEAAERIRQDFHLDQPVSRRPDPVTKARAKQHVEEHEQMRQRWGFLCDVIHEADAILSRYTPETIDKNFDKVLEARCKASQELDLIWEGL